MALEHHISRIVVDNFYEISLLEDLCKETGHSIDVLLRITPEKRTRMTILQQVKKIQSLVSTFITGKLNGRLSKYYNQNTFSRWVSIAILARKF